MKLAKGRVADAAAVVASFGLAVAAALSAFPVASIEIALLVSVSFAVTAWFVGGVDVSGSIAGTSAAFVFYRLGGWRLFAELLFVFVVTLVATRVAAREKTHGRTASQVVANLIIAMAVLLYPGPSTYTLVFAALTELAADTVSSEIGEAYGGEPMLISTLRKTTAGANGGITFVGSISGVLAALLVVVCAGVLGLRGFQPWISVVAGVSGMFLDSLIGATIENKGWLSNNAVNLLGTASSAAIAAILLKMSS